MVGSQSTRRCSSRRHACTLQPVSAASLRTSNNNMRPTTFRLVSANHFRFPRPHVRGPIKPGPVNRARYSSSSCTAVEPQGRKCGWPGVTCLTQTPGDHPASLREVLLLALPRWVRRRSWARQTTRANERVPAADCCCCCCCVLVNRGFCCSVVL